MTNELIDVVKITTVEAYSREWKTVSGLNSHKIIFENPHKKVFDVDGAIFTLHFDENDHLKLVSFNVDIDKYIRLISGQCYTDNDFEYFSNDIDKKTGIDISKFIVSRIDIVADLDLPNPVESYLEMIVKRDGYLKTGHSKHFVEFQNVNSTKTIRLIDFKMKLMGERDIRAIRGELDIFNMLRIEYVIEDAIGVEFNQIIPFSKLGTNNVHEQFKPMLIEEINKIIFKDENSSNSNKKEELLQLLSKIEHIGDSMFIKLMGGIAIPTEDYEVI